MDNPARDATGKLGAYGYTAGAPGERGITDILKDIVGNLQGIVQSEVRLARVEIEEEGGKALTASKALIAGAVLGLYALGFLLVTIARALELALAPWLSSLIVGVVLLICAAVGISIGRERLRKVRMPKKTIQTTKEDIEWMKEQARS